MTSPTLDRDTILQTVRAWTPDEQLALAAAITRQAQQPTASNRDAPPQRPGWREMVGAARLSNQATPSDEQVAHWLDEHRQEKYGA